MIDLELKTAPVIKSFAVKEHDTDEICPICKKTFKRGDVVYTSFFDSVFTQMHQACFDEVEEDFYIKNRLYPDLQEKDERKASVVSQPEEE